ncbi:MAG: T9SS type A sorting domain-containing protein, partial [Winogradskyella sp.]|uniref:proprotein convertase P-domain-containing protein n=1 Tax=Winogradskyella sp. TaxID=1883156 RepID=UPI001836E9D0|nr:T9SS type A sorting domain-containing protein [Winogradskyella sp.]
MKKICILIISFLTFNSFAQVCTTETNNTSTPITSTAPGIVTISISEDVTITDINMCLDITHQYLSDLGIVLTSPSNTAVSIILPNECNGTNIDAVFDDDGTPLNCDVTINGVTQATQSLSAFNGESAMGDWTLSVADTVVIDDGVINSFCIEYCGNILNAQDYIDTTPFTIFPNPTKDKLSFITQEDIIVTLFDLYGRKVMTSQIGPNASDLDLSEMSSGNYIVEILSVENKR